MRLTRLDLHGFKSFADHTHLDFESGVTAIVGPNGCGKSNVSDAVRWVLGEQRARALRGARMDEVIFQGSSARRAVNIAEVSLHFANDDGTLPVPFQEVVVTRRLSRSGESEYLLNRAPCRLRDIHDLVRGTGLGADSGVVIEARMIDALLSDRPDERRELFEEAAGVGLYRDRRRTTERRLEETTLDLARLDDLIGEVQSQVRSLARQRKKAERHAEVTSRRFAVELTLARREMAAWRDELAGLEEGAVRLRATLPAREEAARDAERRRDDAHGARSSAETQRAELARQLDEQRQDASRLESELRVAEERQRNAAARRERAEEERRAGESVGHELSRDHQAAEGERQALDVDVASSQAALEERRAAEEASRQALALARTSGDDAERRARELDGERRRLTHDRESADRESTELSQRASTLGAEAERLDAELAVVRDDVTRATRRAEDAARRVADTATALEAARTASAAARDREADARALLLRAEELVTASQAKLHALEALERERVGLAPAAARLLRERAQFGEGAILGPLSDFVSTDAGPALLVERFLGPSIHAILIRDRSVADAVRTWHARVHPGPLLLLPLDAMHEARQEEGGGSLAEAVTVAEPARSWARELLGRVRAETDGASFVDARGAVWLPGSSAGPGPLRRRAEIAELREALRSATAGREGAAREAEAARVALGEAERAAGDATESAAVAQLEARSSAEERDQVERRLARVGRERTDVETQAGVIAARRMELEALAASLARRQEELDAAIASHADALAQIQRAVAEAEHRLEGERDARTGCQVALAQVEARRQVAMDRASRISAELSSAGSRLEGLATELSEIDRANSALAAHMALRSSELEARSRALAECEVRSRTAEESVRSADEALLTAEHALDDARRHASSEADELHHAELRLTELAGRRAAICERLEAEWRRSLDEMLANTPPLDLGDDELRDESGRLRAELEVIGPVNALAIEEHDEELKRLAFLTAQRLDVLNARNALQQAIAEIDVTARELFLDTFVRVRENFKHIFMTLFGGGECDIRLENPEAPLECDIEIHASPRGKRTQRIHLLSSGERALVALSLLFGIFLTKPSPFCLLDEVDAPLDDQNVGRFVRMLQQFKDRTQFIVITHNPRTTTEAADAVYGVTMQEPGVSSFVSVRMRGDAVEETVESAAVLDLVGSRSTRSASDGAWGREVAARDSSTDATVADG